MVSLVLGDPGGVAGFEGGRGIGGGRQQGEGLEVPGTFVGVPVGFAVLNKTARSAICSKRPGSCLEVLGVAATYPAGKFAVEDFREPVHKLALSNENCHPNMILRCRQMHDPPTSKIQPFR